MNRFNIGDYVKILRPIEENGYDNYIGGWAPAMAKYINKIGKIVDEIVPVNEEGRIGYKVSIPNFEDYCPYVFDSKYLEKIENQQEEKEKEEKNTYCFYSFTEYNGDFETSYEITMEDDKTLAEVYVDGVRAGKLELKGFKDREEVLLKLKTLRKKYLQEEEEEWIPDGFIINPTRTMRADMQEEFRYNTFYRKKDLTNYQKELLSKYRDFIYEIPCYLKDDCNE